MRVLNPSTGKYESIPDEVIPDESVTLHRDGHVVITTGAKRRVPKVIQDDNDIETHDIGGSD